MQNISACDSLLRAARSLLVENSYESVSVSSLCHEANVSRSAFYKLFESKDAVYCQLVRSDFAEPLCTLRGIHPSGRNSDKNRSFEGAIINSWLYHNFVENKEFYVKLLAEKPLLLQNVLIESIEDINIEVLRKYKVSPNRQSYMAYFFAANHAMLIVRWIENGMDVAPEDLAGWYSEWSLDHLMRLLGESGERRA